MITQNRRKIGDIKCVVVKHDECETASAVVILCHGFGAPSTDLVTIGEELLTRSSAAKDVVYIFPAAPIKLDPLFDTRAWWMIDIERIQQLMMQGETRELSTESPVELPELRQSITKLIDHCRVDYKVSPDKIILGGFSQGAMLATDVSLNYHEALGGVIVWSGNLINQPEWTEKSKSAAPITFVQSHGRIDPVLPMLGAEALRDMLNGNGHKVRFCEFEGQHSIPHEAIELAAQLIGEVAAS